MKLTFKETFAPKYSGKLFKVSPAKLDYELELDTDATTPEGKDIQRLVEALWKKEMEALRKEKEKEYAEAISITEKNILRTFKKLAEKLKDEKKLERWLEEEAKGANVMIKNAMTTFESIVKSKGEQMYEKAAKAVDKKYKTELRKRKFKAVLKIAGHVTLILVTGAIAIAATVVGVVLAPEGVGVAIIAGAVLSVLGVSIKSGKAIYDTVKKEWPTLDKSLEKLQKAAEDLEKAVAYAEKKRMKKDTTGKLSLKDKLKLLFNDIKGNVRSTEAALANCGTYCGSLRQNVEEMAKSVNKMEASVEKVEKAAKDDPKLKKRVDATIQKMANTLYKMHKARTQLAKLDKAVIEGKKLMKSAELTDPTKLKGFVGTIQRLVKDGSSEIRPWIEEGKGLFDSCKELVSALT